MRGDRSGRLLSVGTQPRPEPFPFDETLRSGLSMVFAVEGPHHSVLIPRATRPGQAHVPVSSSPPLSMLICSHPAIGEEANQICRLGDQNGSDACSVPARARGQRRIARVQPQTRRLLSVLSPRYTSFSPSGQVSPTTPDIGCCRRRLSRGRILAWPRSLRPSTERHNKPPRQLLLQQLPSQGQIQAAAVSDVRRKSGRSRAGRTVFDPCNIATLAAAYDHSNPDAPSVRVGQLQDGNGSREASDPRLSGQSLGSKLSPLSKTSCSERVILQALERNCLIGFLDQETEETCSSPARCLEHVAPEHSIERLRDRAARNRGVHCRNRTVSITEFANL